MILTSAFLSLNNLAMIIVKCMARVMIGMLLAVVLVRASLAACSQVEISPQQPVTFGTVYAPPSAQGFIQVDPIMGFLSSEGSVAYSESHSVGEILVIGPPRTLVVLGFELDSIKHQSQDKVQLVEIIVRHADKEKKFGKEGGEFTVRLPDRTDSEGSAASAISVGAVLRYRALESSRTKSFHVFVECIRNLSDS